MVRCKYGLNGQMYIWAESLEIIRVQYHLCTHTYVLYKNYTSIITCYYLNQPSAQPGGHRVEEPELLLFCSTRTTSALMTTPPLTAHSANAAIFSFGNLVSPYVRGPSPPAI